MHELSWSMYALVPPSLAFSDAPHLLVRLCRRPLRVLCVFHVPLSVSFCRLSVCLSPPDSPCPSHNSHPSYTAAQPVEDSWARCQSAGAPVGQSIRSVKDMLSTQVYPPGLEPWSPVRASPRCPSTRSGAPVWSAQSALLALSAWHQGMPPAALGLLKHVHK